MNDFRTALFEAVLAGRDKLPFVTDVRQDAGLLRIVLTMEQQPFFNRQAIHDWMFDCVFQANKRIASGSYQWPIFRGMDLPSLERALRGGIDVEPSDAHWYGAELEKALEYGPAVLIIDAAYIERPYRDVLTGAPAEEHAAARAWAGSDGFPVLLGKRLRYSRLPSDDRRRGSDYESHYSWRIPGDPRQALIGVIECRPSGAAW